MLQFNLRLSDFLIINNRSGVPQGSSGEELRSIRFKILTKTRGGSYNLLQIAISLHLLVVLFSSRFNIFVFSYLVVKRPAISFLFKLRLNQTLRPTYIFGGGGG